MATCMVPAAPPASSASTHSSCPPPLLSPTPTPLERRHFSTVPASINSTVNQRALYAHTHPVSTHLHPHPRPMKTDMRYMVPTACGAAGMISLILIVMVKLPTPYPSHPPRRPPPHPPTPHSQENGILYHQHHWPDCNRRGGEASPSPPPPTPQPHPHPRKTASYTVPARPPASSA